jgi:hypothetical protein
MSGTGFDKLMKIMPRRQLVIPAIAGAIGMGALTGLLLGIFMPTSPGRTATAFRPAATPTGGTNTPSGAASVKPTASASASPSPSATATVKVVTGAPDAPPSAFIDQPWTARAMEFATLEDVQRDDRGVTVQVRRGRLLIGEAARRYLNAQGQDPADFAVVTQGNRTVQYLLRDDAAIFSQYALGDHENVDTKQMDPDEFYDAARGALDNGVHPGIWLRHSYGIASQPIIYLAEQYLP